MKIQLCPTGHCSLQYIPYLSYFHMCKQWDLLKIKFNYVPLAPFYFQTTYLSYFLMYVSSGLVEIKKIFQLCPTDLNFFRITYLDKNIFLCKQWDLNPHSFTLLFPKNSLSTNFNMLT